MADSLPLLCQPANTNEQESHGHSSSPSSLDEIIEQSIGGFGWSQFAQAVLVSLASLFDSQQSFISVYTDAEPITWHCLNNTTCNSTHTIVSEWGLECSRAFVKGLPAASHFTGCLLGIIFLASLADSSLGRKNLLFLSCLTMSVTASLTIFSNNVWVYSLLRFLSGISRSTIGTCTIVLLTENVGRKWRGLVGILDSFFFTIGTLTLPAIAYMNRGFSRRIIYLWTSIPTLLYSALLYIFVSESPRWPFMQDRQEEAIAAIKSLSPIKDYSKLSLKLLGAVYTRPESSSNESFLSSIKDLFVRRWALQRTQALMVLGFYYT